MREDACCWTAMGLSRPRIRRESRLWLVKGSGAATQSPQIKTGLAANQRERTRILKKTKKNEKRFQQLLLAELHILIDADGSGGGDIGRAGVGGGSAKAGAAHFDRVVVWPTITASHGQIAGRTQFVQRAVGAVQGVVHTLSLGNGHEIMPHAHQIDRSLWASRSFRGGTLRLLHVDVDASSHHNQDRH